MSGILRKIAREIWLGTLLFAAAFLIVEALLNFVAQSLLEQTDGLLAQMPFVRTMLGALLGIDIEGEITAQLMQAFVWVHPVVLALIWAHEIMICTRYPVGEIDRGTIDVLLGLPVSRRTIYLGETLGWLVSGTIILAAGSVGYAIGSQALDPAQRPGYGPVSMVLFNLFCVYVAIGGMTFLVSSLSDRRGKAISTVFGLLLASFLVNFLAQFWAAAQSFAFLGVLNYYRPAMILSTGAVATGDVATLLGVGAVFWIAGCEITVRRSICTI